MTPTQKQTNTVVTSVPDPSVFGQPVSLSATVAAVTPGSGTPTGTVTFTVDGAGGGAFTAPLNASGVASVSVGTLGSGNHGITATYNGDAAFASSTGTDTHTVNRADTATAVDSSPDPSVPGQEVTFTATVTAVPPGAGVPTGDVVFTVDSGPVLTGTLMNGVAIVATSALSAGPHIVTAAYQGSADFAPSTGTGTHTVNGASTTTTVTSSPDPSVYGQAVSFTAVVTAVAPATGVPTGTVTFDLGGDPVTAALDSNGVARVTNSGLHAGSYTITATYGGDSDFNPSTGSDTQTVDRAPTTTVAASLPDPSVFGQEVAFTATVTALPPGAGTPTGSVTFTESGGGTAIVPLDASGVATLTTDALTPGTYSGTATYSGDADFAPSAGSDTHVVTPADTTTTVTSSPDPSVSGQAVSLTAAVAAVAPGAGTPAGTVTFTVDGTTTLTGTLVDGLATVSIGTLTPGVHTVAATYAGTGDPRFNASTGTDTLTVDQAATTTSVASTPDPSVFGQPITFTAAVVPVGPGAGTPTGTVTFALSGSGGTTTVPLDAEGNAQLTLNFLPADTYSVTATYNGDSDFSGSTGSDTHTVDPAATTTNVTSAPDPSAVGQTVTVTATVSPIPPGAGTPSGTVTFTIDGGGGGTFTEALDATGTAQLAISTLELGSHTITATYDGDTDFVTSAATDPHTVEVEPSNTTTLTSGPDPSVFGQPVTFTATVTPAQPGPVPTGTVTFTVAGTGGGTFSRPLDASGAAQLTLDTLGVTTHAATATYGGDSNYSASTGADTHTVIPADTTTSVASSPDPTVFGQTASFTATVAPVAPGAGTPTGTVTFTIDGTTTLTGTLDASGTATVSTSALPAGNHAVEATYNGAGDPSFNTSSGTGTHTVNPALTTTTVNSTPDPSVFGQPVTFTAVVVPDVPGAGVPTGTVTFVLDGAGVVTAQLEADGTAAMQANSLTVGSHSVTATYNGDGNFASSSGTATHTVDPAATVTVATSDPDPTVSGQTAFFSAVVATVAPGAGVPTGTVTFVISDGPTLVGSLDTNGVASVSTSALPAGSHAVTATYNGDISHSPSEATETHTVNRASTTTVLVSTPDPSVFGQQVAFTVTVTPVAAGVGVPTGTVTISGSEGDIVTLPLDADGVARGVLPGFPAGSYAATATYDGDSNFAPSTGADTHVVNRASTSTVLVSTPDPSVFGQDVTFTAAVTPIAPGAGVPTGTVTITDSGGASVTLPLDSGGVATGILPAFPPGAYAATATYNGDSNFAPSTGADTHTIEPAATTTTVNSSPDPTVFGQAATFTATVTPVPPGAGIPTGTVTFTVDGTTTLTGTLDGTGTATVSTSTLPAGSHTVQATYSGDIGHLASGGSDTHTVDPADTETVVNSGPDPSVFGQPVTVTALVTTVPPGDGTPTGTVTFALSGGGGTTTVPLNPDGSAQLSLNFLPADTYSVTATYNGDAGHTPSTGTDSQTVQVATTTVTVTSSPDPSTFGEPVTVSATVSPVVPGAGTPTGTVTFTITGTGGGTFTEALDATGTAQLAVSTLALGSHTITATYDGAPDYAVATGTDTHTVEVEPSNTTTLTSGPDPSVFGQPVTFTATVTPAQPGPVPTGTVTFTIAGTGGGTFTQPLDASGAAQLTLDSLGVTTHAATATYGGDTNYSASSGADTHTVDAAATTTSVVSSPDPTVFGQTATFTATVAPVAPGAGTPAGIVTFTIDGPGGGAFTGTLDATGTTTISTSTLAVGSHTVQAAYIGDGNYAASTGADSHTVDIASTTTTVNSTPDPSVYGQDVTFTATVVPVAPATATPAGTVTFTIDGGATTTVGVDPDGIARLSLNSLAAGGHSVTATYNGDANFSTSTGTGTHTVAQAPTQTTVVSTPDPTVFGQTVVFAAVSAPLSPGAGPPTGTVTFSISGGPTLTASLDASGIAVVSLSTLPAGTYTITATYNGDANFSTSTGTDTHTVNPVATMTVLASTPDPSVFGEDVTFTVTVTPIAPGAGVPTGTVTVTDNRGVSATLPLDSQGVASDIIPALEPGSYAATATYNGDANHLPSSGSDTQVVNRAATTTTVTSTPDPSVVGQLVTFTAVVAPVAPGAGIATGTVTFTESGGGTITVPLDATGVATFTSDALAVGTYSETAVYNGDANFAPSSGADTHTVIPADTTTSVASSPDPTVFGQTATFTATVTPVPPGAGTPAGTVTFTVDGTTTLTGTLDATGTATVGTSALPAGSHTIEATYNGAGDPSFNTSTGTDTHTVNPALTTTTVNSAPAPSVFGQPVTFTATVTPVAPGAGTPAGTVTFVLSASGGTTTVPLNADGTAQLTLNSLPADIYSVSVSYSGDSGYEPSTGSGAHTVNRASTTTAVSSTPDPSALGAPVTVSATVTPVAPGAGTPTGTVTFAIAGTGGGTFTEALDATGTAQLAISTLELGSHAITATYNGDTDNLSSTGTDTHSVEVEPSNTTTLTSGPDPSVFGQPVTFTATVIPTQAGPVPTGTVTFTVAGTGGGTFSRPLDASGTAQLTLDTLGVATHAATVAYGGDTNYSASTGADTHTVIPADTTTSVASSPDPTVFGQTATFTATVAPVAPGAGTPTGTVTFTINGTTTLTGALDGTGTATVGTSALPAGAHTIAATYNGAGDPSFNTSTGSDTHTVNPADTTTSVNSSPDPTVFGQPVTFTAVVVPDVPGAGMPTGTVTFTIDGGGTTTVPVEIDGTARLTLNSLPTGSHSTTGSYSGDGNFTPSTGGDTHTVNKAATTTTLNSAPDPSTFGQTVTFTATVTPLAPGAGTPTGTVTFSITGGPTLTGTLDGTGVATVNAGTLPVGNYAATATYAGDSNFTPSTGSDAHTVDRAPTTTTVNSAPDPSTYGQTVTVTATVAANLPEAGTPTGTVTFLFDGTTPVTAPLVNGVATTTTSGLSAGPHTITATYGGALNFATSNGTDTQTVNRGSTTTTVVSSPDPSLPGRVITFTATVSPTPPATGTPTGTVTFTIGGGGGGTLTAALVNGVATVTDRGLAIGTHAISATYNGDPQLNPSTGNDTHTVSA
ncbi:Ig-like domain-containing protein [Streptomyces bathyalis]|uniref:Ig-like domain-containing protein n=1 Tax=Streptomyces bathyalis TaxID=2710756 RepID=UPI001FEA9742|nr:Ig-like domain-containing protein [Streptomyces bathyalis]